jgi:hypothetical protein
MRLETLRLVLSSRRLTPAAAFCRAAASVPPSADRLKVTLLPEALTGLLAGERAAARTELFTGEEETGLPEERARLDWLASDMLKG